MKLAFVLFLLALLVAVLGKSQRKIKEQANEDESEEQIDAAWLRYKVSCFRQYLSLHSSNEDLSFV